jgi:phage terminase large subunit-like protein
MLTTWPAGSHAYAIAADRDQGALIVDAAAGFKARTEALASAVTINNFRITSNSGSILDVLAADAASSWGIRPRFIVADEFCQWPNTANARALWQAIHSAMGKVADARLLCMSTSGDPAHWSHKVYETAKRSKRWSVQEVLGPLSWVSEDFLEEQRSMHPESVYRRLHLNEWAAGEDRLTNLDDVRACVTLDGELPYVEGRTYVIGMDLGLKHDRTVGAVMHAEREATEDGREVVVRYVLDRMQVWSGTPANPVNLTDVEEWGTFTARAYRAKVVCDPWQAISMVQRMRSKGVTVEEAVFSQPANARRAVSLHTAIRDHRLSLPDNEELIDELINVRLREVSPNVFRLDHDPDRHDDRATALSLALVDLATRPGASPAFIFADDEHSEALDGRRLYHDRGWYALHPDDAPPEIDELDDADGPPRGATMASPWR